MASTCTEPPYAESLHGSVETDSMNVAPYDELTEDLQSPQSNSTINSNTPLAPVSGPAGTTGLEFPYLAHQGASSSSRGPSADLRKKFKVVFITGFVRIDLKRPFKMFEPPGGFSRGRRCIRAVWQLNLDWTTGRWISKDMTTLLKLRL